MAGPRWPAGVYFRRLLIGYFAGLVTERGFAHGYETGGTRRVRLRNRSNILERLLANPVRAVLREQR